MKMVLLVFVLFVILTSVIPGPWGRVFRYGWAKLPFKVAALVWVLFLDDEQRNKHPIFGVRDAEDLSWYNIAFRNGCHNMYNRPMPRFITTGDYKGDETLEKVDGFQWRVRESAVEIGPVHSPNITRDYKYVSFRATFGKVRPKKGKYEVYGGWTMNEKDYMRLTFVQVRLPWYGWLVLIAAVSLLVKAAALGLERIIA